MEEIASNTFVPCACSLYSWVGLYVLRDNNNIVRYVAKGDVEARLLEHSLTPDKSQLVPQILWNTGELSPADAFCSRRSIDGEAWRATVSEPKHLSAECEQVIFE